MEKKVEKPKFYILNIEKCKKEDLGPCHVVKEIMIMDGQYECDFDVIEDQLPVDVCNAHRYETPWVKRQIVSLGGLFQDQSDYIPLGINIWEIPHGAVLVEIK